MLPLDHGSRPSDLVVVAADEVTFLVEVIVEGGMDGAELLQRFHPSDSEHCPLSPSERLVRILSLVVYIATDLLPVSDAKLLQRSTVRPQAVGGNRLSAAMALHEFLHELQCSFLIALFSGKGLQNLAFMIHGAPQVRKARRW